MTKKGRKKTRTHVPVADDNHEKFPKSLVMRRGKTAHEVADLVHDLRQAMMPYTALHFQEDTHNRKLTLQHYAKHIALPMGITHLLAFSQRDSRLNLRLGRTPEGPTLHFRVHEFSLTKHLQALQKRPVAWTPGLLAHPPVVVTNNFSSDEPHVKLMRITFQNLFPAINVATVKLAECRRVILFHLVTREVERDTNDDSNQETSTQTMVEMRHYAIQSSAAAAGVGKRVRKLTTSKKLPNLSQVQDIADYVTGQAAASVASDTAPSDSEAEGETTIDLPSNSSSSKSRQRSALKLVELGPRLSLGLVKVEKGLGAGDVLYHAHVQKSPTEVAALKAHKERQAMLKQERRQTQDANVERKRRAAEDKRQRKRQRQQDRQDTVMQQLRGVDDTGSKDCKASDNKEER